MPPWTRKHLLSLQEMEPEQTRRLQGCLLQCWREMVLLRPRISWCRISAGSNPGAHGWVLFLLFCRMGMAILFSLWKSCKDKCAVIQRHLDSPGVREFSVYPRPLCWPWLYSWSNHIVVIPHMGTRSGQTLQFHAQDGWKESRSCTVAELSHWDHQPTNNDMEMYTNCESSALV